MCAWYTYIHVCIHTRTYVFLLFFFTIKNAHIENPKDATRKLLELIDESGKVAGYKINTQKSLAFLYTNKERADHKMTPLFKKYLQER